MLYLSRRARLQASGTAYKQLSFLIQFDNSNLGKRNANPVASLGICSVGEYSWGGAASTAFWVDPAEALTVSFFTQLLPSSTYRGLRPQLRQLVYQSLTR